MRYVVHRLLLAVPTVLGAVTLVFLVIHLVPGDPVQVMLGDYATPEAAAHLRAQLGLNKPLPTQFARYLSNALTGNLGLSIRLSRPVADEVVARLPYTGTVAVAAVLISLVIGLPLGMVSAVRRNSAVDYVARSAALVGVSMPAFWLGVLMILLFSLKLKWFPVLGSSGTNVQDFFYRATLPSFTLGLIMSALIARITRSSMLEVLHQDYVRTARAKGLPNLVVLYRHALKNALLGVVTIAGLNMGRLLGGAVVTETVFNWPGLGKLFIDGMYARDYPLVQGVALVFALGFILTNLVTDLVYSAVNPMLRYD